MILTKSSVQLISKLVFKTQISVIGRRSEPLFRKHKLLHVIPKAHETYLYQIIIKNVDRSEIIN